MIKNSYGYYDISSLRSLKIENLIKLLIAESSYQETLNVVRAISLKKTEQKQ